MNTGNVYKIRWADGAWEKVSWVIFRSWSGMRTVNNHYFSGRRFYYLSGKVSEYNSKGMVSK